MSPGCHAVIQCHPRSSLHQRPVSSWGRELYSCLLALLSPGAGDLSLGQEALLLGLGVGGMTGRSLGLQRHTRGVCTGGTCLLWPWRQTSEDVTFGLSTLPQQPAQAVIPPPNPAWPPRTSPSRDRDPGKERQQLVAGRVDSVDQASISLLALSHPPRLGLCNEEALCSSFPLSQRRAPETGSQPVSWWQQPPREGHRASGW